MMVLPTLLWNYSCSMEHQLYRWLAPDSELRLAMGKSLGFTGKQSFPPRFPPIYRAGMDI